MNRFIVSFGRKLIYSGKLPAALIEAVKLMNRKLFGEDDEAGEEGELDKAKAEGENGKLSSPRVKLTFSGGD